MKTEERGPIRVTRYLVDPSPYYRRIIYECPKCSFVECEQWPKAKDANGKSRPDVTIIDRCVECIRNGVRLAKVFS